MSKKFSLKFCILLALFTFSCANQKKPSTLESSAKPVFVTDEQVSDNRINETYSKMGYLYSDEPKAEKPVNEYILGEDIDNVIVGQKLSEVALPDVPMVLNQQVQKWMNYFQGSGRKYFVLWLARSGQYVPMMKQILKENGIPEGLIYLSMIESGFKPYALSRAKAVGPWQFMKFTGARYGLRANYWIDERMDPEKSTIAAAQHLKDLYDEFNHWYLAAAGYNAGAGKISRAIVRYRTEDFWEMSKYKYLRPETKNYVPKLLAASLISSDPEKYGFTDIQYQEPIPYDKVLAPEPVAFDTIASALEISVATLRDLNPEIRRDVTPPNYPNYELKVPAGYQAKFLSLYPTMARYKVRDVVEYYVKSGDTLSKISKKHGVSVATISQFNDIKSSKSLRKGQKILVPVASMESLPKITRGSSPKSYNLASVNPAAQRYVVQSGDTLWTISRKFNVTVSEIRRWNRLRSSNIQPGQRLAVSD